MKCSEVITILEKLSPTEYACEWDNVGLMVGEACNSVNTILVTLDADDAAIDKAVKIKADMIISHHPLIFSPLKKVNGESLTGKRVLKLIKNNIACYSMHTNFDIKGGMAQLASDMIGISNPQILEPTTANEGLGRVGEFNKAYTVGEWCQKVKDIFNLSNVILFGDIEKKVTRVAIAPGAGKDSVPYAIEKGAQLLITGDIGHHAGTDAVSQGLNIIDAGHYGIEHIFIKYIVDYLNSNIGKNNVTVIGADIHMPYVVL